MIKGMPAIWYASWQDGAADGRGSGVAAILLRYRGGVASGLVRRGQDETGDQQCRRCATSNDQRDFSNHAVLPNRPLGLPPTLRLCW